MAIDGTWRRACKVEDACDGGAKLTVEGSIDGLPLNEFFLVLPSTGLGISPLRTRLGQWQSGWCLFPEAG
jgi:hypothetical protein